MNKISIAITGHRPNKLWGYDITLSKYKILEAILIQTIGDIWHQKSPLYMHQCEVECITGMALGVDTIFAQAVLELKQMFPMVKLVAAIPCQGQSLKWNAKAQQNYFNILKLADERYFISNNLYAKGCMNERNQYMIDRCDVLIAVWNGDETGGTYDAVKKATKANKEIIRIDPKLI
jgi:uncharacterized phage-like protein YoqJ